MLASLCCKFVLSNLKPRFFLMWNSAPVCALHQSHILSDPAAEDICTMRLSVSAFWSLLYLKPHFHCRLHTWCKSSKSVETVKEPTNSSFGVWRSDCANRKVYQWISESSDVWCHDRSVYFFSRLNLSAPWRDAWHQVYLPETGGAFDTD